MSRAGRGICTSTATCDPRVARRSEGPERLGYTHGGVRRRCDAIRALARASPALATPLDPELPYIGAEIVWAAREEMARSVEDALARRNPRAVSNARARAPWPAIPPRDGRGTRNGRGLDNLMASELDGATDSVG